MLPSLEELSIRDVGVIDAVTLRLGTGLNVLTGETGAGKTMIVSALDLLLGGRADADQVRAGARSAVVEGRLHPPPASAGEWLADGDDDLVVSREVSSESGGTRSRARLGGRLAPVSALAEVLGPVVEVHGQSDSARLASPAMQRELLDRYGGASLAAATASYGEAYGAWVAARDELEGLVADARDRARELDRLRFELAEIDAVGPVEGEEERLDAELARLEHAEVLVEAASAASTAIADDGGARDALGAAVSVLRGVAGVDEALEPLRERVEGLAAEAQDVALDLAGYAGGIEGDPARLTELRDRRGALTGLCRKYGPDAAAVVAYAAQARGRVALLDGGEERVEVLTREVEDLWASVGSAGAALREERGRAGERLSAQVEEHLAELAMAGARMEVEVSPAAPGPSGADRVVFQLAANPGEGMLPLGKAASGGERSRVALAVRLALADVDETPVLVFDEVDAGIGGKVAVEVGRKLAMLARGRQVLCVTHLAQLAAFADVHLVVEKDVGDDERTVASVRALEEPERVVELSRMLSGSPDSELATGHAAELRAAALASTAS